MTKKFKYVAVNIFIVLNLLMMIRAQIDDQKPFAKEIFKIVNPIQNYFSLWRGWKMFAPNPLRTNSYVEAKVITPDKTLKYNFLGSQNGTLIERYFIGERFRKYIVEGVRMDKNSHLWEDAALYVLRKFQNENPNTKVLKVILNRKWRDIPKWDHMFIPHKTDSQINYKYYTFYTYNVASEE